MCVSGWARLDFLGGSVQFGGRGFANEYYAQGLGGVQFVRGSFLDASNGVGEACHYVEDPVSGSDGGCWYGVVVETKGVGDALAPRVGHGDMDAAGVLCHVGEVPSLGCMVAPCFVSMWFRVNQYFCSKWWHGCCVEGECAFEGFVCQ